MASEKEHSQEKWATLKDRFGRSWYRFRRNPISLIGAAMVSLVVICAIFAPFIAPYPEHAGTYTNFMETFQTPNLSHLFGTDTMGRDVLSRILFGFRISLKMAGVVLGLSVPFGVLLGLIAGYYGGWPGTILMRITDVFLSLPPLVMALAITAAFTPTIEKAMFAIASIWWTWHARLVYGITRSLKTEDFIQASQVVGSNPLRIMIKDILPNCASPIIVKITLDAGFIILTGAGLSFLGIGVQPPQPGLGTMVAQGSNHLPEQWWLTVFPSFAIFFLILGFNLLGDGLRDLLDVEEA